MKDDPETQSRNPVQGLSPKQIAAAGIGGALILLVLIVVISVLTHA